MYLVVQTQLIPDPEQDDALRRTVRRFNEAANWVAGELFARRVTNTRLAQKLVYRELRERFALMAQMAILVIHRVCEAYKRDQTIRPEFRPDAAITFDPRVMRFLGLDRVNLWTLDGRIVIPMIVAQYHQPSFAGARKQADLVLREDGKWFLLVTVDVPEGTPIPATDFLGIDLGIANLATDSDPDSEPYSGKAVDDVRRKHNLQRKRLQRRGTKGAKKKLRRAAQKEARFRRHENHRISKRVVVTAKRTGRGIAVEDLKGIRARVTARGGDARNRLSGWSFAQLFAFLSYKAQRAGVLVETVDPRNTSRTCAECGHVARSNRKSQAEFECGSCGHRAHADKNAARNIRAQANRKLASELVDRKV